MQNIFGHDMMFRTEFFWQYLFLDYWFSQFFCILEFLYIKIISNIILKVSKEVGGPIRLNRLRKQRERAGDWGGFHDNELLWLFPCYRGVGGESEWVGWGHSAETCLSGEAIFKLDIKSHILFYFQVLRAINFCHQNNVSYLW